MIPSFQHFIFLSFFLLSGFGQTTLSHSDIASHQPIIGTSQLAMFDGSSAKEIMPSRLAKKEYWRPRGTNNEDEDEDDKSHPLKKNNKQRQVSGPTRSYWEIACCHSVALASDSSFNAPMPPLYHLCYGIFNRLHVLFQVFRI